MRRTYFSTLLLSLSVAAYSQAMRVSTAGGNYAEPVVRTNPLNTQEIVITAHPEHFFFSRDGGASWKYRKIEFGNGVRGDPVPRFDQNGKLHVALLSFDYQVILWTLDDVEASGTFSIIPRIDAETQDKPWLVVNEADPVEATILYTAFSRDEFNEFDTSLIYAVRSTYPFQTWSAPLLVSRKGYDAREQQVQNGAVGVLDDEGRLHTTWLTPEGIEAATIGQQFDTAGARSIISALNDGTRLNVSGISTMYKYPGIAYDRVAQKTHISWSDKSDVETVALYHAVCSVPGEWSVSVVTEHPMMLPAIALSETGHAFILGYGHTSLLSQQTQLQILRSGDQGQTFVKLFSSGSFAPVNDFLGDYVGLEAASGWLRGAWVETRQAGQNELWFFSDHIPSSVRTIAVDEHVSIVPSDRLTLAFNDQTITMINVIGTDLLGRVLFNRSLPVTGGRVVVEPAHIPHQPILLQVFHRSTSIFSRVIW